MTHSAKIIADSISPDGVRLTTMEVVFPRIVLAEFNTHRVFSRNSASSRAIPVEKMIRMVEEHPYVPTHWGKNQKGMQADEELSPVEQQTSENCWLKGRDEAVMTARRLLEVGVHKQITNRLLEPFMWHTVIVTATEWDNFFHLRIHPAAHPEIRLAAELMYAAMSTSVPRGLSVDEWHMPLVDVDDWLATDDAVYEQFGGDQEKRVAFLCKVSVGRCARVSYLTHDGRRDLQEDIALCDRLLAAGHMSPFEHVARPMTEEEIIYYSTGDVPDRGDAFCGNFRGWIQYRKTIPHEHDVLGAR